jgi:hypothetical protein
MNDLLVAQVEHYDSVVHDRAAANLLDRGVGVLEVQLDPLGHVMRLEDLVDRQVEATVDQLHHQLVVGDPELPEAAQAGAGVHQEAEEDPPLRIEDVLDQQLGGVGPVNRLHHLDAHPRERRGAAEVVVDHPCGGLGIGGHDAVVPVARHALQLRGVVIERERDLRPVGQ